MHKRRLGYKGVSVNAFGLPILFNKIGTKYKHNPKRCRGQYLRSFQANQKLNLPKNLLIVYDIPEGLKKERDWFRRQLRNFDFIMIQRSVWVGPSLPKDFLEYVGRIGLKKNFRTFKLSETYKN